MYIEFAEYDSFIVKHKINYNTSIDGEFENEPFKMCFIDYDLARKSQPSNASNFDSIYDNTPISELNSIEFEYYNNSYIIYTDGDRFYNDNFNTTNVIDDLTGGTQNFYISNIGDFSIGDFITINIYEEITTSGETIWYHEGLINEVWYVSGITDNGTIWEVSGLTTQNGYSNGTTTWIVDEKLPLITYNLEILDIDGNYIKVYRKLEKYLYNNYIYNSNINYECISLNHTDKDKYLLNQKIEKSIFGNYIDIIINDSSYEFIINPIRNSDDIYFDYDALNITFDTLSGITEYNFNTDNLYNRYNLTDFFSGLTISGDTVLIDPNDRYNIPYTYTGQSYLDIEFNIDNELNIFKEYTYINIYTNLNISGYTALITEISGNTMTVEVPDGMVLNEIIQSVKNISMIYEISDILQKCYLNKNDGFYKKREKYNLNKIYLSYANIINLDYQNEYIRDEITGILYINSDNVLALKIYRPNEENNDNRLTFIPVEIEKIGTDRKTAIPIRIS